MSRYTAIALRAVKCLAAYPDRAVVLASLVAACFVVLDVKTEASQNEAATAAALQDAIAQAQAERPDLWAPETIERAKTAALIAAAGRK